jgi:predicted nicotinamide N-methyase
METHEDLDRAAAIRRYRELLAEKQSLAQNIEWLRSQFQGSTDEADRSVGSDLLFLADYACKERHISVKGVSNPDLEAVPVMDFTVQQRMEKMSTVLWPSSCVLAEVVVRDLHEMCRQGAAILELGCGTAVPSIVAAALGAHVLATDAEVASADLVLSRNKHVLATGAGGSISTAELTWGSQAPDKPWGAVIVADAIYDEVGHAPLAATLASAAKAAVTSGAPKAPRMIVVYQNRRPDVEDRFFRERLPEVGLWFEELSLASIPLSDNLRSCIRAMDVSWKECVPPCELDATNGLEL